MARLLERTVQEWNLFIPSISVPTFISALSVCIAECATISGSHIAVLSSAYHKRICRQEADSVSFPQQGLLRTRACICACISELLLSLSQDIETLVYQLANQAHTAAKVDPPVLCSLEAPCRLSRGIYALLRFTCPTCRHEISRSSVREKFASSESQFSNLS